MVGHIDMIYANDLLQKSWLQQSRIKFLETLRELFRNRMNWVSAGDTPSCAAVHCSAAICLTICETNKLVRKSGAAEICISQKNDLSLLATMLRSHFQTAWSFSVLPVFAGLPGQAPECEWLVNKL